MTSHEHRHLIATAAGQMVEIDTTLASKILNQIDPRVTEIVYRAGFCEAGAEVLLEVVESALSALKC